MINFTVCTIICTVHQSASRHETSGVVEIVHYFQVEIAEKYGINAAIIFEHFNLWIAKNEANGENFREGQYWTYNSIKAFQKLFPYLSDKAIRKAIQVLIDEGLVMEGNFNKLPYDRTKWYAITEKGKSIYPKGQMEVPKRANDNFPKGQMTFAQKGEPIPSNTKNNDEEEASAEKGEVKRITEAYNVVAKEYGITAVTKLIPSTERYNMLKARIKEYGVDAVYKAIDNIKVSTFLQGKKPGTNFKLTFEWFVRPNNFPKILEGNYTDKQQAEKKLDDGWPDFSAMDREIEITRRRQEQQEREMAEKLKNRTWNLTREEREKLLHG